MELSINVWHQYEKTELKSDSNLLREVLKATINFKIIWPVFDVTFNLSLFSMFFHD